MTAMPKDVVLKARFLKAVIAGDASVVKALIGDGFDPNGLLSVAQAAAGAGVDQVSLVHPLMYAAKKGPDTFIKTLIDAGSDPLRAVDSDHVTPLMKCISRGMRADVNGKLVDAGDDVNATLPSGWSVVHTAAAANNVLALDFLESRGARFDVVTSDQITPLHACFESEGTLRWLLQRIPHRVNGLNQEGDTPLTMAASEGAVEAVMVLMEFGADIEFENAEGLRADDVARRNGYLNTTEQIELMRQARQASSLIEQIRSAHAGAGPDQPGRAR